MLGGSEKNNALYIFKILRNYFYYMNINWY